MMKTHKKTIQKRAISVYCMTLIVVLGLIMTASVTYAVVLFSFKVNSKVSGNTDSIQNTESVTYTNLTVDKESVAFTSAGEKKDIALTVSNDANANIAYSFGVTATASADDSADIDAIKSSVLVYFDGEFVGTLADIGAEDRLGLYNVMRKGDSAKTASHTLSLELHISAPSDCLNKAFTITTTAYCQNADYLHYIFVSTEDEFRNAVEDINTGLLNAANEKATIVLGESVSLSNGYEIKYSANIDLNGNKLENAGDIMLSGEGEYKIYSSKKIASGYTTLSSNGKIIVNNEKAFINIADFYDGTKTLNVGKAYTEKVTLSSYDTASAFDLYKENVKNAVYLGIKSGETKDVFGALSCYLTDSSVKATVSGDSTISGAAVTADTVSGTTVNGITLTNGTRTETIEFKVIGGGNDEIYASLLANEFKHIPNTVKDEAITYDILLPKRIENKNVSIEWTSSDEDSISSNGKLADTLKQNATVTLYAKITINESVYTTSFTFKVTSQTRETKFQLFVAQLSPIELSVVDKVEKEKSDSRFLLPSVSGNQAYTTSYEMIYNDVGTAIRTWDEFKDIGLTALEYKVNSGYNFIALADSDGGAGTCVYLKTATFYKFAQLTVTGTFSDGEKIDGTVNVIITLGSNTELYELAFSSIEKKLADIDILQNILDTRAAYGREYERGDFYLDDEYQEIAISYEKYGTSSSAITGIKKDDEGDTRYHVYIDASEFGSNETSLAINVIVKAAGDNTGASRVMYVTAPAVIKADDNGFANYSVYNSVKYQTAVQVAAGEYIGKDNITDSELTERLESLPTGDLDSVTLSSYNATGFEKQGTVVTDKKKVKDATGSFAVNGDYILARDAEKVTSLEMRVGNSGSSDAHIYAYNFARLLSWATGSVKGEALPFSVGTYTTAANGREYMNEDEVAVLKYYLKNTVGFTDDEITALFEKTTETPTHTVNGETKGLHVIEDYEAVSEKATALADSDGETYFKYTEVLQWALNEKDFLRAHWNTYYDSHTPPNLGIIAKIAVDMSGNSTRSTDTSNITSTTLDWSSTPSTWGKSTDTYYTGETNSKYGKVTLTNGVYVGTYDEDETEYISDYEAQCIMAFWYGKYSSSTTTADGFAEVFLASCVIPTYLSDDGAGILINAVYEKLGTTNYSAGLTDGVPEISVLDDSSTGLSYFTSLNSLKVCGKVESEGITLPAFIATTSLTGFFNRVTKIDDEKTDSSNKLTTLVMSGCSKGYTEFALTNISRLTKIVSMDFSYNDGIDTIGDLLNTTIQNIEYLNVHKVNVSGVYLTYVLDNIQVNSTKSPTIYYTNGTAKAIYSATKSATSTELRYLKELTEINSKYLLVTTKVDASDGTSDHYKNIQWYVESGNPGYIVNDGGSDEYTEVTSADELNRMLSNYYIFTENVTYNGTTYKANTVYEIVYDNGEYKLEEAYSVDGIVDSSSSAESAETEATITESRTMTQTGSTAITEPTWTDSSLTVTGSREWNNYTYSLNNVASGVTGEALYTTSQRKRTITITNSSGSTVSGVYLFYRVYTTQTGTYTYRYQIGNVESAKYYINNVGIERYYRYLDITITFSRNYEAYYYSTSSASNSSVTLTKLTDDFTYTANSTTYPIYTNKSNGNYYVDVFTATVNGTEYAGDSLEEVVGKIKTALDNLSSSSIASSPSTYTSYITPISNSNGIAGAINNAENLADASVYDLYKYTGATASGVYYKNGLEVSYSYTRNAGYRYVFDAANGYTLSAYTLQIATNGFNMQAILDEANTHLQDVEFGNYYGNYYCYNGTTCVVNGNTYTKGYVYRLLTGSDGKFYFEHDNLEDVRKTFVTASGEKIVNALFAGVNGTYEEGQILYISSSGSWYGAGLFELTYNETTKLYYFKSMGGVGNVSFSGESYTYTFTELTAGQNLTSDGLSKFINIRYVATDTTQYYSGTGGSETIVMVARILDDDGNVIDERHFMVEVSAG